MFKIFLILWVQFIIIFSDDFLNKFYQHDYDIKFTWADVTTYNITIFKTLELHTFKYNRSLTVVNITWELNIEPNADEVLVRIQGYKFLSNEYREIPLRFQVNFCNAVFGHNLIGSREVLRCGNIKECKSVKGKVYQVCNAYPDESRFPPLIPNGEYKIEAALIHQDLIVVVANGYGKVSRRVKIH